MPNVLDALSFARRWLVLLMSGTVLAAVVAFLVLREIPSVYEARVTLLVSPATVVGSMGAEELRGAQQLARTYAEAARTRPVLAEAADRVGLSLPFSELQERVNARLVRDTQLLRITAEDTDPARAAALANAVADVFSSKNLETQAGRFASSRENLARLVDSMRGDIDARTLQIDELRREPTSPSRDAEMSRLQSEVAQLQTAYGGSVRSYEELRVAEARGTTTLAVVEPAIVPEEPVRPRRGLLALIAALIGLVATTAFAAAAEYLDDGLRDARRVGVATGLVTLGSIPRTEQVDDARAVATGRRAESYRLLLANLQVATSDQELRRLMVASAAAGEGKSTIAANLAAVLAESGQRVILVDADLHRPVQAQIFQRQARGGLSALLLNPSKPTESVLQTTAAAGLSLLAAGGAPADPAALFSSRRLDLRLAELDELCDVVIFDTPPLLAQPDAALLGSHMDAVVVVVDATDSRGRMLAQAVDMLRRSGAPIVGAVLNRVPKGAIDYPGYRYEAYGARGLGHEAAVACETRRRAPTGETGPEIARTLTSPATKPMTPRRAATPSRPTDRSVEALTPQHQPSESSASNGIAHLTRSEADPAPDAASAPPIVKPELVNPIADRSPFLPAVPAWALSNGHHARGGRRPGGIASRLANTLMAINGYRSRSPRR